MMRLLKVLLKKEFLQLKRNKFLPRLILVFPLMVMLVIPWITTLDVHHIKVAVVDQDRSTVSSRLLGHLENVEFFTLDCYTHVYEEAFHRLEKGELDVIIEIPARFEESLMLHHPKQIALSVNAVNAIKGVLGMQYVQQTLGKSLATCYEQQGFPLPQDLVVVQNRYNPTLNYRYYMIPALMIMILVLICGFLPALSIVGEKEKGTIEQINVTPVSGLVFTLSKLIPYWLIGLFILSGAMLIAWGVYGLVPAGSLYTIYIAAFLFILSISGMGVAIANGSDNMQQTMFVMFFFLVIFILMSGLLTPITSMPNWAQCLTRFFPPRYFVDIMRAVYLKAASTQDMLSNIVPLAVFAAFFNLLATVTYKKQH